MGIRTASTVSKKTPDEVVLRDIDFSSEMSTSETISSVVSTTVSPAGELAVDSTAISSQVVQLTLSGGEAGSDYSITVQVSTSASQTLEGVGRIVVRTP